MKKIYLLSMVFFYLLVACNPIVYFSQDRFYRDYGWLDHGRFPLIKPYEVIYQNENDGWVINLEGYSGSEFGVDSLAIFQVTKVSVIGNIIYINSEKPNSDYMSNVDFPKWFIIIPNEQQEYGFLSEDEFLNFINEKKFSIPDWHAPSEFARRFYWTLCLDWIPACK